MRGREEYMSKSSVRTVFSEISFSVDRPRDMQDIKDVKPQVDHLCCRRNSDEHYRPKYGFEHSKCVSKSLSEMLTCRLPCFLFFFSPSPELRVWNLKSWSGIPAAVLLRSRILPVFHRFPNPFFCFLITIFLIFFSIIGCNVFSDFWGEKKSYFYWFKNHRGGLISPRKSAW